MPTLVLLSDTHGLHRELAGAVPEGDILLYAGDFCDTGRLDDAEDFNAFLGELPHRHKIVIAGNHDWCAQLQADRVRALFTNAIYLEDEAAEVDGLKFYGSPWQPEFFDWAFQLPRGEALREKWELIPPDTDVLITHGPPFGVGDETWGGRRVGCRDLLARVQAIKPRLHVFGHIHEARGVFSSPSEAPDTFFVNASAGMDAHPPIVVELCESRRPQIAI